ncbi:MAG: phosphoribosylaminoimidazolesuccinocarboxamide synthase, partial [Pseudomonadota bacterium]
RGKVRDVYQLDDEHLLIVTTDRLSAFDVVLPDAIPGKGAVLTAISSFWFARTASIVANHLTAVPVEQVVPNREDHAQLAGRAIVVRRLNALPIEAVVRGYLAGSGWKDYLATGAVCGIALPAGLALAQAFEQPLFTPATKAAVGDHDENISFARCAELVGADLAARVRDLALALYEHGRAHAARCGIIIADTKFEFGLDGRGEPVLIDEAMTPDSSRFWPAASYRTGISPPSYDKQFVRDYLESLDWDKTAPGPTLPPAVIEQTVRKYAEAQSALVG